jgi:hypothetical protein
MGGTIIVFGSMQQRNPLIQQIRRAKEVSVTDIIIQIIYPCPCMLASTILGPIT